MINPIDLSNALDMASSYALQLAKRSMVHSQIGDSTNRV
jgi:hypothetical protein